MKTKLFPVLSFLLLLFVTSSSFAQIKAPIIEETKDDISNVFLQDINAFPNPFQDYVTLSYTLNNSVNSVALGITDMKGNTIWKTNRVPSSKGSHNIPLRTSKFQDGYYQLTIQIERSGHVETQTMKIYKAPSFNKGDW